MKGNTKKTRKRGDARTRSKKPAAKAAFDPAVPLANSKHEAFVMRVFNGLNFQEAYLAVYGGDMRAAQAHGSRLVSNGMPCRLRLDWLKAREAERLAQEVPIKKIEAVRLLYAGLNLTLADVSRAVVKDMEGDALTPEERVAALLATEVSMTPFGPKYKITPWMERLGEIGEYLQWKSKEMELGPRTMDGLAAIAARVRGQPVDVAFGGK